MLFELVVEIQRVSKRVGRGKIENEDDDLHAREEERGVVKITSKQNESRRSRK